MRKATLALGALLLFSSLANAQETPQAELGAGYSYLRLGGSEGLNQQGGSFSAAANLNHWLGIVGDVGYYHANIFGASANTMTYQFGPRFSYRSGGIVTPFAQVLVGGARLSAGLGSVSASVNGFAVSAGGGIDVRVSEHVAIRALQLEYVRLRIEGEDINSGRASAGIVFRFGSKK